MAISQRPAWSEGVEQRLAELGRVNLIVGLVTAGPTPPARDVVAAARTGLEQSFSGRSAVIAHADLTTSGETEEAIAEAAGPLPVLRFQRADLGGGPTNSGHLGRRTALRAILGAADRLEPDAVAVLNPGLVGTSPAWLVGLAGPVAEGKCELVLPLYQRRRYEGTLTQALVAPVVRALFGAGLAHPLAEEFACSLDCARRLLDEPGWDGEPAREMVDLWLPAAALASGITVGHAALGPRSAMAAPRSEPLGTTVGRVAGTLFGMAEAQEAAWLDSRESRPAPTFGEPAAEVDAGPAIDLGRLVAGFRQGVRELFPLWERILAPDTLAEILPLGEIAAEEFRFPERLWVRVVYDFLLAWHFRVAHRPHVAQSLAPLYLGRTASFVGETRGASPDAAAAAAERLGRAFELDKRYLVERWH